MRKKKPEDEQQRRMRLYEQSVHAQLVALCQRDLRQAEQDLAQAVAHGDRSASAEHAFHMLCLQAQAEHYGPVIIDGSVSHLVLPERIEAEQEEGL